MSTIVYKKKDESVSWEEIRQVVFRSHESNRKNGVDIRNAHLSSEELAASLGKEGACFVALDGEKVVGTCSVAFREIRTWFAKGKVAYLTLAAILPEYKGRHIFKHLSALRNEYIKSVGCKLCYMNVAEYNHERRAIAIKEGFVEVAINYNPYNPHNYITYCYWYAGSPFPKIFISFMFLVSKSRLIMGSVIRSIKGKTCIKTVE